MGSSVPAANCLLRRLARCKRLVETPSLPRVARAHRSSSGNGNIDAALTFSSSMIAISSGMHRGNSTAPPRLGPAVQRCSWARAHRAAGLTRDRGISPRPAFGRAVRHASSWPSVVAFGMAAPKCPVCSKAGTARYECLNCHLVGCNACWLTAQNVCPTCGNAGKKAAKK